VVAVDYGQDGSDERKRLERRRYIERRAQRTAVRGKAKKKGRRPWAIDEAKTALDLSLTVPEAALMVAAHRQCGRVAAAALAGRAAAGRVGGPHTAAQGHRATIMTGGGHTWITC
jgi:hypothetical protein